MKSEQQITAVRFWFVNFMQNHNFPLGSYVLTKCLMLKVFESMSNENGVCQKCPTDQTMPKEIYSHIIHVVYNWDWYGQNEFPSLHSITTISNLFMYICCIL